MGGRSLPSITRSRVSRRGPRNPAADHPERLRLGPQHSLQPLDDRPGLGAVPSAAGTGAEVGHTATLGARPAAAAHVGRSWGRSTARSQAVDGQRCRMTIPSIPGPVWAPTTAPTSLT